MTLGSFESIVRALADRGVRYLIAGGLAVNAHGYLRFTMDVDVVLQLDAANIAFNLLKMSAGEGITVGPILLGAAKPVHILTPTATVRRLVNMAALASVDASFIR